ncbi:histidine kinase, partial [Streptosporangium algeriense]
MDHPQQRFTELYDRHYRNVLGYALLRAERQAAEDVVSETFLITWRRLREVPDPALPWLLGRSAHQQAELVVITAERAMLQERARIAHDMHDTLGHELSLLALRAGALE